MLRTRIPSHLRAAPPLYRLALHDSYWQLLENKKLHEEEMTAHAMAKAKVDLEHDSALCEAHERHQEALAAHEIGESWLD